MSNIDNIRRAADRHRGWYPKGAVVDNFTAPEIKYRDLEIKLGKPVASGQYMQVYRPKSLEKLYGRKNLCLKLLRYSKDTWGATNEMGFCPIVEATIIQNLLALDGKAPRVYELVTVGERVGQVVEYLEGEQIVGEIKDERFIFHEPELQQGHNFVDGKLVDFQGARFRDFQAYRRSLQEEAMALTAYPQYEGNLYQSTSYASGKRDTARRVDLYEFDDLTGKIVLDIGCNLGMMSRAVYDAGAKRVVGIDWPRLAPTSAKMAIMDGYFNIDIYGADLRLYSWPDIVSLTGIKRFDVCLFLAMEQSLGNPKWLKDIETVYWEGHGVNRKFMVYKNGEVVREKTISDTN